MGHRLSGLCSEGANHKVGAYDTKTTSITFNQLLPPLLASSKPKFFPPLGKTAAAYMRSYYNPNSDA